MLLTPVVIRACVGALILSVLGCGPGIHGYSNSTKVFTGKSEMRGQDLSNPTEMERAWQAALVRIPTPDGSILKSQIKLLEQNPFSDSAKIPTVIYLHGCTGIWKGTFRRMNMLAKNGFAVIAPISFARKKYPRSCSEVGHKGGLFRWTLRIRQSDAGYAIEQARKLPWVDGENLFLMGLSEGGITTATFKSQKRNRRVNARVVEGWTCFAGWEEYRGINAPELEPVLTLVGSNDPWFQNPWNKGDCGPFLSKTNGSQSIVFKDWPLRNKHELMESKEVQELTINFLRKHLK